MKLDIKTICQGKAPSEGESEGHGSSPYTSRLTPHNEGAADPQVIHLYEKADKVYPREIEGRYQRLRSIAVWVLLGIYYVLPWIEIGGRQIVLFDLPARKFYVFGLVFWPQDFIFLTGLLILAALSLFFFTALAGRMWCGYACPQTVWTEVFLVLERWAEGDARKRRKLDAAPWTGEKVRKKAMKQFLFITFALWTGFTFVGFFTPIRELAVKVWMLQLGGWETFWILFYSLATYGNAGYLREQVCKYMCPYARFQGAMFDRDTLVISYDVGRGEPRGARSRKVDRDETPLGDCIDCTMCVQVCPTGIDIREGLQYECIACGLCADACDQVMDRMEYPRGLIRYTTQNAVEGKPSKALRPRTLIYAALLAVLTAVWSWGITQRPAVSMDVLRDRNALYRVEAGGRIENVYTLRVLNRSEVDRRYRIEADGIAGLTLQGEPAITLRSGEVGSIPLTLSAPSDTVAGRHDVHISVVAEDDPNVVAVAESRFFGPMNGP